MVVSGKWSKPRVGQLSFSGFNECLALPQPTSSVGLLSHKSNRRGDPELFPSYSPGEPTPSIHGDFSQSGGQTSRCSPVFEINSTKTPAAWVALCAQGLVLSRAPSGSLVLLSQEVLCQCVIFGHGEKKNKSEQPLWNSFICHFYHL